MIFLRGCIRKYTGSGLFRKHNLYVSLVLPLVALKTYIPVVGDARDV